MTDQPAPEIRRLYRSRTDSVIGGVCGGIAAYFRIDPVLVRVGAVASIFLGGAGLVLYLAALLLMPKEGEDGGPGEGPSRPLAIAGVIVLVIAIGALLPFGDHWWGGWPLLPLGLIALAGLLAWRLVTGDRPKGSAGNIMRAMAFGLALLIACGALALGSAWAAASGGDTVVAVIVLGAGLALIAGAFAGAHLRWLILPALAVALPAGVVGAAGIDLDGGVGERTYRPRSSADLRPHYEIGMGQLVLDLRRIHLPPGAARRRARRRPHARWRRTARQTRASSPSRHPMRPRTSSPRSAPAPAATSRRTSPPTSCSMRSHGCSSAMRSSPHAWRDRAAPRDLGQDRRGARVSGVAQAPALQPSPALAVGRRATS